MGRLFGTDGVRGVANVELTCALAMQIGAAAACVLAGTDKNRRTRVAIGMDTRISSPMLALSVAAGLNSAGADALLLGVTPTPAVAYLVGKYRCDAGIMISASHNPPEFNGIKLFSRDGTKLPDDLEERIEGIIASDDYLCELPDGVSVGQTTGLHERALNDYIAQLISTVDTSLDGLKIAVDCANGAAGATARRLFTSLGAQTHMLGCNQDGAQINVNCGSTHMDKLSRFVVENQLDAGIAFDGDADRCLCVDETGNLVDGDMIMAICARDMKSQGKLSQNTIVGTVMSNLGFVKFCQNNGIAFESTRVGDRYVLEKMLQDGYNLGGEQSGHIIFRDHAATGDGQLTALRLLSIMRREGKPLSALSSVMTRYPQHMINVPVSPEGRLAFYTDPDVQSAIDAARDALGEDGRILVRTSGTEPVIRVMTEGESEQVIRKIAQDVADVLRRLN